MLMVIARFGLLVIAIAWSVALWYEVATLMMRRFGLTRREGCVTKLTNVMSAALGFPRMNDFGMFRSGR